MLQLEDRGEGLPANVLDRILIAEPVRPFDRIIHMPLPTVFAEVAETGRNAALRGNRMTPPREHFRDACGRKTRLNRALSSPQTGAAGTDNDHIECMVGKFVDVR